ncbi:MAG: radical SAM family heme chaperone HemW [Acidobacteriaceae bacterium]|nr:radical SAM family heme chaperone HemW [Acidobacteriaceae bacterium]
MSGVYISYPFCTQKCTFCNFASGVSSLEVRTRYERALLNELERHRWLWLPETLYFGGGTPSLMPLDFLREVMSTIPLAGLTEVTLECAPGTVTPNSAKAWKECGVNRVSLGGQSFIETELRQTGRRHTAATIQQDVAILREAGISNINLDLIAGLPGQTATSWKHSLDWIERLEPPHVSVYIFEVDEDSRLGKEILQGADRYGASRIPNDDLTAELYETAVDHLAAFGLARYEISNFARIGWESRHNLKYWRLEPYIGFGLDAHSFDGVHRWSNPDKLERYFAGEAGSPRMKTDPMEEHFFVGLRLMGGIEPTGDESDRFAGPIEKWVRSGMLERNGNRLRLSDRGVLLSNEIFEEFIS